MNQDVWDTRFILFEAIEAEGETKGGDLLADALSNRGRAVRDRCQPFDHGICSFRLF